MAISETIPSLGSVPQTSDPANFDARADTLLGTALPAFRDSVNTWAGQANSTATTINANAVAAAASAASATSSETAAVAAANFAGAWANLTGALNIPASVSHNDEVWLLLTDLPDVTASEPSSGNSDWLTLSPSAFDIGDLKQSSNDLSVPEWLPANGSKFLQSSYAALYAILGNIFAYGGFKLPLPASTPPNNGISVSFDGTGEFLAVGNQTTSPLITVYFVSGSTFTKLANPASLPSNNVKSCAWDAAGDFLATGHDGSPYLTVYFKSGTGAASTLTKLANPASLPPSAVGGLSWDSTGTYLFCGADSVQFRYVYKRTGTGASSTLTLLATITGNPSGPVNDVNFSPDNNYVAVAHTNSPYLTVFSRSGDNFTKLSDPVEIPSSTGSGVSWDATSSFLAFTSFGSPKLAIYEIDGTNVNRITVPDYQPAGTTYKCRWSETGSVLMTTGNEGVFYKFSDSVLTKLPDITSALSNTSTACDFGAGDRFSVFGISATPYVDIYDNLNFDTTTEFRTPYAVDFAGAKTYIKAT